MKIVVARLTLLALCLMAFANTNLTNLGNPVNYQRFSLPFYAQPVAVTFDPAMLVDEPATLSNVSIRHTYNQLEKRPTQVLLNHLLAAKGQYQLNDFLFFKLARRTLHSIYGGQSPLVQNITLYKLLIDSGFDARLTFRGDKLFVNVYTTEDLFEVPIIQSNGRTYANISCLAGDCKGRQRLYIYNEHPNPRGKSFGFQLKQWPQLAEQPTDKSLEFNYHGVPQKIDVTFDKTMVDIMTDYPFIHEYCYLDTPLSPTLSASLLPQLETFMQGMDTQQKLELLTSFTRSAFAYKEDNEYFGRSKPMVPEELFGYSYSDCEDRSALFFALVRDLLDLPMAVIAYDDHLTVAVGTDIPGDSFNYKGQRYLFCDPTGPRNSSRVGQVPPGYEDKSFTVIGTYN
ncbi:hypothetical protein CLV84_2574 [Neolewinella xylanilytica]|uniref:Transglutaminase superfamily protein n=1 Tax=Neolewinella xylanilytica TaxID=1514080 RepID=A0A2S6I3N2_9BACT|nr:hypothetical protein [Neolewinella xylanilytica]PPK85671.1 hypothetical protein CLV84_2574 [Neolewinella xylanilytica]